MSLSQAKDKGFLLLIVLTFLWGVLVRFGDLDADPAFHLSKSAGVLFDPFSHSGNARSYVLFGDLHPDEWNTYVYSPIFVLLQVVWFSIFGVTIKSMHAYGAMWSILAVACSWFAFRNLGKLAGFLALLFFSSHYLFYQFGRLALLENAGVFFTLLTFLMLSKELTYRRAFFCGAFAFLVFVTKATVFYVVPATGCAVVVALAQQYLRTKQKRQSITIFLWYLAGTLAVVIPWLFLFRIPNHEEISRVGVVWWESIRPYSLSDAFNFLIDDQLFQRIDRHDLLSLVALCCSGVVLYRLLTDWRKLNPIAVMCLVSLVLGALFVGLIRYKAARFSYSMLPMLLGLSTIGLIQFYNEAKISGKFRNWWAADISALICCTAIYRMELYLHPWSKSLLQKAEFGLLPGQWDSLFACFLVAIFTWSLVRLLLHLLIKETIELPRWLRTVTVALFVLHFLYGNLSATNRWYNDHHHSILEANKKIKDRSPMVIGGLSVHALTMETPHRAVRIQHDGWHNSIGGRIFTDLGLTHLLLTDYNFLHQKYLGWWPEKMRKLKRTDVFWMCGQTYHLYEFPHYNNPAVSKE